VVDVLVMIVYKKWPDFHWKSAQLTSVEDVSINPDGVSNMNVDLAVLKNLISKRPYEIEKIVLGTGYLAKTVMGVGTFLLDNEGDVDLLSSKQKVVFDKFIQPLLTAPRR
jgi:hypothetical protein